MRAIASALFGGTAPLQEADWQSAAGRQPPTYLLSFLANPLRRARIGCVLDRRLVSVTRFGRAIPAGLYIADPLIDCRTLMVLNERLPQLLHGSIGVARFLQQISQRHPRC